MMCPSQQAPINLTAVSEGISWSDVVRGIDRSVHRCGSTLDIRGLDDSCELPSGEGLYDTIYIVVSGYGVLRYGENSIDWTVGDVLFVPKGYAHRFERLDGEIRIWRISPAPVIPAKVNPR
jgi:mannose-6-phosphate isomerase-like protein (cupin superfamily)